MPEPAKAATDLEKYRIIKDKQDELVLAATDLAAVILPFGGELPKVVNDETGNLEPMPETAQSLGEIQKQAGVDLTPDMKTEGIMGYGSRAQRRVFVTEEGFDIDLTVQEIRKVAYEMFMSIESEDIVTSENGMVTRMTKRASGSVKYYTLVLIAKDFMGKGDIFPFWVFPKVAVTKKGKMSLAEAQEMGMPLTFTVFEHQGKMFEIGLGGAGWVDLAKKAGFVAVDKKEKNLEDDDSNSDDHSDLGV